MSFDGKNRFFSIFFKLSQTVSSNVKMVPKCFATLRATPKTSGHMLGSFENFFQNDSSMYPEALGVALRVAKHLGTILTSLETVWDNLKKIEKHRFF